VFAVADGTVVSIQDGRPDATPNIPMKPVTKDDYGGNHVILEIAPISSRCTCKGPNGSWSEPDACP
jgi:hypothetical protein